MHRRINISLPEETLALIDRVGQAWRPQPLH